MIHLQISEAGKRHALRGDHAAALERYRHALTLAVRGRASPVFLYHYTECILDALEADGRAEEALALAERALDEKADDEGALGARVRTGLMERRIVLLFTLGREAQADAALAEAGDLGGAILGPLRDVRRRRLTVTRDWLTGLRRRAGRGGVSASALRGEDADIGERYFIEEKACG